MKSHTSSKFAALALLGTLAACAEPTHPVTAVVTTVPGSVTTYSDGTTTTTPNTVFVQPVTPVYTGDYSRQRGIR